MVRGTAVNTTRTLIGRYDSGRKDVQDRVVSGHQTGCMASVHIEFEIGADTEQVWRVIGDWVDGPVLMARGHVESSQAVGQDRVVTFADGFVARERLITRDDEARRIVYSLIGDTAPPEHDNAVMQIVPGGVGRCRFIWSRDVLPDAAAQPLREAMQQAVPIITRTLASDSRATPNQRQHDRGGGEQPREHAVEHGLPTSSV